MVIPMNIQRKFIKYVSGSVLGMIGMSCYILADTFFIASLFALDGVWLSVTVSECVCAVLSAVLLRKIVK